jgi:membrane-associated protease RseP (regulator of RpoE activity)
MSTRGAVLLAMGMLILGLLLGMVSGGITGFLVGQNSRIALGQNFPGFRQGQPNLPGQRGVPQQPNANPTPGQGQRGLPPTQAQANGAVVTSVEQNSPAASAGVQSGDVITGVDNAPVDQNHSLADLIGAHKPGDKVTLAITRGSQNLTLNVTLGQSPQDSNTAYLGIRFSASSPSTTPRFRGPGDNNNNFPNG